MDPAVDNALRGALALLLLAAGLHKLRDPERFRAVLRDYRLLPARIADVAAPCVIAAELGLGLGLLAPVWAALAPGAGFAPAARVLAPLGAGLLFAAYGAAIGVNLARGRRDIDCGCAGPGRVQPLSGWLLPRNGALVVAALACALPVEPRTLLWPDAVTMAASVSALSATWATVGQLIANGPPLARLGS